MLYVCDSGLHVTINVLVDDVLLEIFIIYLAEDCEEPLAALDEIERWHRLVHVCRRWRGIVFAYPRRLDLRLVCTAGTRVKDMLDIWPALPLVIRGDWYPKSEGRDEHNIIAALEHNDRVCQVSFHGFPTSLLQTVATVMQKPFPTLTYLNISSWDSTAPILPNKFLGGSGQNLQSCILQGVAFPGMQKLLLSAHQLVTLLLRNIPDSGYISPQAMVTCLSAMPSLKRLHLVFQSPLPRPEAPERHHPILTRVALPSLTSFLFKGVSEYLEDLLSQIDIPLLDSVDITFFNQLIFDIPQLHGFLARTETLTDEAHGNGRASVEFEEDTVYFNFESLSLMLGISCAKSDWQISSMAQICTTFLPHISVLERLSIRENSMQGKHWQSDVENVQWLELFHPFTALKDLYLDTNFAPRVALVLKELVGETVIEELPALQLGIRTGNPRVHGTQPVPVPAGTLTRKPAGRPLRVTRVRVSLKGPQKKSDILSH